jgi:hypothetical protein
MAGLVAVSAVCDLRGPDLKVRSRATCRQIELVINLKTAKALGTIAVSVGASGRVIQ